MILKTIILSCLFLIQFAHAIKVPAVKESNGNLWFPNTSLEQNTWRNLNTSPVIETKKGTFLFAVAGALVEIDKKTHSMKYYKPDSSFQVEQIAHTNDEIWLAERSRYIHRFSIRERKFLTPMDLKANKSFGSGANIQLYQDPQTGDIWMATFSSLVVYRKSTKKYENMDYLYTRMDMGKVGNVRVFFDSEYIILNTSANVQAKGGLLFYDRSNGSWSKYRKELTGEKTSPARVDDVEIVAGPNKIWATLEPENGYNKVIASFDRKTKFWTSYKKEKIVTPLNEMLSDVGELRWFAEQTYFSSLKSDVEKMYRNYNPGHSAIMPPSQSKQLLTPSKKIYDALKAQGRLGKKNIPRSGYYIDDYQIFSSREGKASQILEIPLSSVSYKAVIGEVGRGLYLVHEAKGLALLDTKTKELRFISPRVDMNNYNEVRLGRVLDRKVMVSGLIRDLGDVYNHYLVDLTKLESIEKKQYDWDQSSVVIPTRDIPCKLKKDKSGLLLK